MNALATLWRRNPAWIPLIGLAPLLGASDSLLKSAFLGLAAFVVLTFSSGLISLLQRARLDAESVGTMQLLIVASLVAAIERLAAAFLPELHRQLGLYLPLLACSCLLLGRSADATPQPPLETLRRATGYALALIVLGAVREALGRAMPLALLPAGGFIALGLLIAAKQAFEPKRTEP